jgi:hypothetical protein
MFLQLSQDRIINAATQLIEAKYKAPEGNGKAPAELTLTLAHNGRTETIRGQEAEQAWDTLQRMAATAGGPMGGYEMRGAGGAGRG